MSRTAKIVNAGKEFGKLYGVICMNDSQVMIRQPCRRREQAQTIADMWHSGKSQGEIAAYVKDMKLI